jgi:hypothetical protein
VQIGLSVALYMRILLLEESFDFRPSSQCILVVVIPSCFRFVNVFALGKSHIEVQAEILDILLRNFYLVYMDWGQVSLPPFV